MIKGVLQLCVLAFSALLLGPGVWTAGAVDWYVSPNGAGTHNGTSYGNSWSNLASVVLGGGGVVSGDTLYITGGHALGLTHQAFSDGQLTIPSGVTIRMDYPGDPGMVFCGAIWAVASRTNWFGPDVNGVYWSTNIYNTASPSTDLIVGFEVDGTNVIRLTEHQSVTTWVGGLGGYAYSNHTNYVKTSYGGPPTNNIALPSFGWYFNIAGHQNITFYGGRIWTSVFQNGGAAGASNITFRSTVLSDNAFPLFGFGNDYWTIDGVELSYAKDGLIYLYNVADDTKGAHDWVITNSYLHHTDIAGDSRYSGGDGHSIGVRAAATNITIVNSHLGDSASCIELFGTGQSNVTIARNLIDGTHAAGTDGGGVTMSGGGIKQNFSIYDNIFLNIATNSTFDYQGLAIGQGGSNYIKVWNNTIVNANAGIYNHATDGPARGQIVNNIIINPRTYFIYWNGVGTDPANEVDYNLFYSNAVSPTFVTLPSFTHDAHSLFTNPRIITLPPTTAAQARLAVNSPAIYAGTNVGLALDYTNLAFAATPSIGAFEYHPFTNIAASCSQADVQAAANLCNAGDYVLVPAGTCTFTTNVFLPAGVSLIGAGIDTTVFVDEISTNRANRTVFTMSGTNYEFAGFTLRGGVTNIIPINFNGAMRLSGRNWRAHDFKMFHLRALGAKITSRVALIDHSIFDMPGVETFQVYEPDGLGYASWSTDVLWGTTNAVCMEDNLFANNSSQPAVDCYGGARLDFEHNIVTNSWIGNHGTDSSHEIISCRSMDVHNNVFIFPTGIPETPWPWAIYLRGGTARIYSNSFAGRYSAATKVANYRSYLRGEVEGSPNWTPWGGCTGSNVWDGDTDSLGYPSLHQVGRGKGDLLTGNPPLNSTTGTRLWTHDVADPVYSWSNSLAIDSTQEVGTQHAVVLPNRDYFFATIHPTYPGGKIYPDSRITGSPTPPPTAPPAPASNLRIITASNGNVSLSWDASPTVTVNNYKVYYGPAVNNYTSIVNAGNVTSYTASGQDLSRRIYFAVTAVDGGTGLESAVSNEVNYDPPPVAQVFTTGSGNIFGSPLSPMGFGQW